MNIEKKSIYIIGLGLSGIAAARTLSDLGHSIYVYDDGKKLKDVNLSDKVKYSDYEEIDWSSIDYVLLSPGIATTFPQPHRVVELAKQYNVPYSVDIEFFVNLLPKAKIIAVTGTNGKSTTSSLIYHIMKESGKAVHLGGNIGVPVFDLPIIDKEDQYYVLELSSYQLEIIKEASFNVAILLNLTPDHIDRHGDMNGYISAKLNEFKNRRSGFVGIVGKKCTEFEIVSQALQDLDVIYISDDDEGEITKQIDPTSLGNIENAIAAIKVMRHFKVRESDIIHGLKSYKALAHRLEYLGNIDNVAIYNDSKATNAESTLNALKQFDNLCLVLGGVAKDGGIELLFNQLNKVKQIYLIGEAQDYFAAQLSGAGYHNFVKSSSLSEAFNNGLAFCKGNEDNIVFLFSPACASFDMWQNFTKRGDAFKELFEVAKSEAV